MVIVVRLSATVMAEDTTEVGTTAAVGKRLGGFGPPSFISFRISQSIRAGARRDRVEQPPRAKKLPELLPAECPLLREEGTLFLG
jgi:hypothetical protein